MKVYIIGTLAIFSMSLLAFNEAKEISTTGSPSPSGDSIKTVTIGKRIWTKENLNVCVYRNGDSIPEIRSKEEWLEAGSNQKAAWCYYDFDSTNGEKYGKLYNWYAVADLRGLAPAGWHVATKAEWKALVSFLGEETAAYELKDSIGWEMEDYKYGSSNGWNSTGFTGKPGGELWVGTGVFTSITKRAYWWTSTEDEKYNSDACGVLIFPHSHRINMSSSHKPSGMSVRCVKD